MILHLPGGLVARLDAVDGFTGGTLKTKKRRDSRSDPVQSREAMKSDVLGL